MTDNDKNNSLLLKTSKQTLFWTSYNRSDRYLLPRLGRLQLWCFYEMKITRLVNSLLHLNYSSQTSHNDTYCQHLFIASSMFMLNNYLPYASPMQNEAPLFIWTTAANDNSVHKDLNISAAAVRSWFKNGYAVAFRFHLLYVCMCCNTLKWF